VQIVEIGRGGVFSVDELEAAIKPAGLPVFPATTLMEIENTHNRAGGVVVPQPLVLQLCAAARTRGLACFLDGARLWNASAASGRVAGRTGRALRPGGGGLQQGPGCAGRVAAGRQPGAGGCGDGGTARRMGGAMRQNGIFAAAALHALDHHLARLPDDHAHARLLAETLAAGSGVQLDLATVQTNIVVFHLPAGLPDAADGGGACARARRAAQRLRPAHGARGDAPGRGPRAVPACGGRAGGAAGALMLSRP
jgi:threonine aldolase